MSDTDVEAWHVILADVPFGPATTALAGFYRDEAERRIMPADVVGRVRAASNVAALERSFSLPDRPDQAEINERGVAACRAAMAGVKGPLAESIRKAVL